MTMKWISHPITYFSVIVRVPGLAIGHTTGHCLVTTCSLLISSCRALFPLIHLNFFIVRSFTAEWSRNFSTIGHNEKIVPYCISHAFRVQSSSLLLSCTYECPEHENNTDHNHSFLSIELNCEWCFKCTLNEICLVHSLDKVQWLMQVSFNQMPMVTCNDTYDLLSVNVHYGCDTIACDVYWWHQSK